MGSGHELRNETENRIAPHPQVAIKNQEGYLCCRGPPWADPLEGSQHHVRIPTSKIYWVHWGPIFSTIKRQVTVLAKYCKKNVLKTLNIIPGSKETLKETMAIITIYWFSLEELRKKQKQAKRTSKNLQKTIPLNYTENSNCIKKQETMLCLVDPQHCWLKGMVTFLYLEGLHYNIYHLVGA